MMSTTEPFLLHRQTTA